MAYKRKPQLRVKIDTFRFCQDLINTIQALEDRASKLKLFKTARALNTAKNAAGWELAEQMELAMRRVP